MGIGVDVLIAPMPICYGFSYFTQKPASELSQ